MIRRTLTLVTIVAAPWAAIIGGAYLLGVADYLPAIAGIIGAACAVLAFAALALSGRDDGTYRRDPLTDARLDEACERLRDRNVYVLPRSEYR